MPFLDTVLVIVIIGFLILLTWSRVMKQTMLETVKEIMEMFKGGAEETVENISQPIQ